MIFVGRIHPIKGFLKAIEAISEAKLISVLLTIVGPMEDKQNWSKCKELISSMTANLKMKYVGSQKHKCVSKLISNSHALILLPKSESFGHAIFESLMLGGPVIISDTPWRLLGKYGVDYDMPLYIIEDIARVIEKVIQWTDEHLGDVVDNCKTYSHKYLEDQALENGYTS